MNTILPLIPEQASTLADRFEPLFWYITLSTGLAGLLVYAAMLYFCVRYRRGATTGSTPRILGSERLEITWTIIPAIIFFSYYAWGVVVFTHAAHAPKDSMEIYVIGKQWMWKAQYSTGQRVIIGGNENIMSETEKQSRGRLVIPINRPTHVILTSEDVIHDFGIPAFRNKIDVIPGRYTHAWYTPTKLGEYHIFCDQYCGTWHSLMVGKVLVVGEQEFDDFLRGTASLQGTENPVDGSMAFKGRQLFLKLQCISCHTGTDKARAPVLENLFGSRVALKGGGAEIADEAYIRESILKPRAKVVEGWEPIMPSFEGQVTNDDINALVAYIRGLKRGTTPDPTAHFPAPVGAPTERPEQQTSPPTPPKSEK
jgi:cytochrome c oxidase subunit 2